MSLTRAEILGKTDLPTQDVSVPEWGDGASVRVRCLTAKERIDWGLAQQKSAAGEPGPNPLSMLVALAAVDDDGQRLFTVQDSDGLGELRGDLVDRIADAVLSLSGLTEAAAEAASGKSGTAPNSDSGSD